MLDKNAGPQTFADLAGAEKDNLTAVYAGRGEGIGLYEVHSSDGGDTWSEATTVSRVYDEDLWPVYIDLHIDRHGYLHAVWSEVDSGGFGQRVCSIISKFASYCHSGCHI